ncbi:MAG: response regulator transcription factor [Sphingomonadales bacterium]|nr:MAG: response regulator transcription factor [Sphingomonadales bacterium]
MRRRGLTPYWKPAAGYGLLLGLGTFALQWFDYQRFARAQLGELAIVLVAAAFLVLGVVVGIHLFAPRAPAGADGNPQALASLGISARELDVLRELAAGRSNKEIAERLHVSPNTVKTHVARLFDKLGAERRTDAIARARDLGILP